MTALMSSYGRLPISISHGDGAWLEDTEGRRYLDALGGIAVIALGHCNERVSSAIADQARTLIHTSNLYGIPLQEQLGAELCSIAGMDKVFFCNSGAEANEAAIKIARLHGHSRGISNPTIIVMDNAFHGRTLATLTATGNKKIQTGFEPLVTGFTRAPFSDLDALERIGAENSNIVGVMLEPIQGEGGIRPASQGYLSGLRQLCDQHNWLMITDEIQSGMGRTGKWFASQHENVVPDVITVAKALGNGMPIGACMAHGQAAELIQPGSHGTTFGGNPLACRAGLAVIEEIKQHNLLERATTLGTMIREGLKSSVGSLSGVVEIRGDGLMIGVELDQNCPEMVSLALDAGLLINVTAGNVIRLLPPYTLTDEEARLIIDRLSGCITTFFNQQAQGKTA